VAGSRIHARPRFINSTVSCSARPRRLLPPLPRCRRARRGSVRCDLRSRTVARLVRGTKLTDDVGQQRQRGVAAQLRQPPGNSQTTGANARLCGAGSSARICSTHFRSVARYSPEGLPAAIRAIIGVMTALGSMRSSTVVPRRSQIHRRHVGDDFAGGGAGEVAAVDPPAGREQAFRLEYPCCLAEGRHAYAEKRDELLFRTEIRRLLLCVQDPFPELSRQDGRGVAEGHRPRLEQAAMLAAGPIGCSDTDTGRHRRVGPEIHRGPGVELRSRPLGSPQVAPVAACVDGLAAHWLTCAQYGGLQTGGLEMARDGYGQCAPQRVGAWPALLGRAV